MLRTTPNQDTAPSGTTPVKAEYIARLVDQVSTIIVGKREQVSLSVICLLAGGHLLIEDVPGVGKTTLAQALARSLGLSFSRIQFTADLLPSDLTGVSVYERQREEFVFHPGPVFANVLLADEINRAGPRTQSALLEAMEERQVSAEGETRRRHRRRGPFAAWQPPAHTVTAAIPTRYLALWIAVGHQASLPEAAGQGRLMMVAKSAASVQVSMPRALSSAVTSTGISLPGRS